MNIADALRATSGGKGRLGEAMTSFEGISYGAHLAGRARSAFGPRDAASISSSMRSAAGSADDFDRSMQSSAGSANKLSGALGRVTDNLRQNYKAYMSWAAIGGLVGSALSDLSQDADRVVESYYSMGTAMSRTRSGMRGLIKDTWNLSKMSGDLEMAAARMNMPAEAARGLTDKLLRSVRTFYGVNGKIRRDLLGDAARQILAFSRITGASVDQSVDLYAKMTNQYGRTHRQAVSGLQAMARAGQLVNEELQDMGKDGGLFIEDLTGVINDASGAFEGFTLNIEHLAARTAHAVKIGQQLGMSYNQAADTAKQMTAIFAKPGGYVGFQAGEQLRLDIQKTLSGLTDVEDRARALSAKYGINLAQGRTLDIASTGPNAQMNVMEVLKGTTAGMEKSFSLMQEQARNNSMSTDVFKQFVGGENLSTEQAGDLMQLLRDQNSTFADFQRHLDRTKREASADKVLQSSILVPTMVKEWIKGTSGAMKMNIAAALTGLKFGLLVFGILKFVSVSVFILKAIRNMGTVLRNIDAVLTKNFGKRYTDKRDMIRNGFNRAKEGVKGGFNYLKSGQLFDDAKHFFASAKSSLLRLVDMFQSGRASVTIRGYGQRMWDSTAGARGAVGRGFERLRERGAVAGASVRDYVTAKSAVAQEALRKQHEAAVLAFERVRGKYTGAASDPEIVKYRHKMMLDTKAALEASYARSHQIMGGIVGSATNSSRKISAFARAEWAKRERYQEEALRAGTGAARAARDSAVRMSRRMRQRRAAATAEGAAGAGGGATTAQGAADVADALSITGVGGGVFGALADMLYLGGGLFGGGGRSGPPEGVVEQGGLARAKELAKGRAARLKAAGAKGLRVAGELNHAAQPVTKNLSIAARIAAWFNGSIKTDAAKGLGAAISKPGSFRRRTARGLFTTAGSWAARNTAKVGSIALGAASLYSVYSMLNPGDDENGEEGEKQLAGGRKNDEKIRDQDDALQAISEQIDIAKLAGDKQTEESLRKEYALQQERLHLLDEEKNTLDAKDRQRTEIAGRIEKLKKAKKNAKSEKMKKLLELQIEKLEGDEHKLDEELAKAGMSSTSLWERSKSTAAMVGLAITGFQLIPLLAKIPGVAGAWNLFSRGVSWLAGKAASLLASPFGKIPYVRNMVAGIGKFVQGRSGALLGKIGSFLGGKAAQRIPIAGGLITGVLTGMQTEGSAWKKLFVGAGTAAMVTGAGALGAAVGTAVGGPVGTAVGSTGAQIGASMYAPSLMEKAWNWIGGDKDPTSTGVPMARPDEPNSSMAGSNSNTAARGTGQFTSIDRAGSATLVVKLPGFAEVVDRANTINDRKDTGVSGG